MLGRESQSFQTMGSFESMSTSSLSQTSVSNNGLTNQLIDSIPPPEVGEYDVIWETGVLGLSIKNVEGIPLVKRITRKGTAQNLDEVKPGDFLIMVNDRYTSDMAFGETMDMLRSSPKPILLRFLACYADKLEETVAEEPDTMEQEEYQITWGDESLGIVLEESPSKGVTIRRLTGDGLAAKTGVLSVDDELISVANVNVSHLGFKATIQFLRCVARPTELVFRRGKYLKGCKTDVNPALDSWNSNVIGSDLEDNVSDRSQDEKSKQIVLYWTEGPLGMTMKVNEGGKICLSRLTGRGTTPGIWKLHPNDVLVYVNEYETDRLTFADTMNLLKTLPLPLTLVFQQQEHIE